MFENGKDINIVIGFAKPSFSQQSQENVPIPFYYD